jgi:L,D-transpeptidase ErfK/SrfK
MRTFLYLLAFGTLLGVSAFAQTEKAQANEPKPAEKIQPLVGEMKTYKTQPGDTVYRIARHHNVNMETLARMNSISGPRVPAGRTLLLPSLHIVPRSPADGIVLNIPERRVYIFKGGKLVAHYSVAVGKPVWPTPTGAYQLVKKEVNPQWVPTKNMVERAHIKDDPVPPGPENPLGDRWMGWSAPGFGFHSTNAPQSVGKAISHGCVRLYPDSAERMFNQVRPGMTIYSVYAPVQIGQRDGKYFLTAFPDIYNKGLTTLAHVQKELMKTGLLPLVKPDRLTQIVKAQDSAPHRIVGADVKIVIDGETVPVSMKPTQVKGRWVVPVRPVVEALKGEITVEKGGGLVITGNGHRLSLSPGQNYAVLDKQAIKLPATPTVVEDNWMAPLRSIADLFGARVDVGTGGAIQIHSAAGKVAGKQTLSKGTVPPAVPFAIRTVDATLTPAQLAEMRGIGARLLARCRAGALTFLRPEREPAQIQQIAARGCYMDPDGRRQAFSLALLHTLDWLAAHATAQKPLVVLSLYRPLSPNRPYEPHGNGAAADIAAYGGHPIDSRSVSECVEGVLSVIKALGPGFYRLGLPKPPDTDPVAFAPPPERPTNWPFFPAPQPAVVSYGVPFLAPLVAPRIADGHLALDGQGNLRPAITRWENENSAPLEDIGSLRVRRAIQMAVARGANIHMLFPDALDHLHLDVLRPR